MRFLLSCIILVSLLPICAFAQKTLLLSGEIRDVSNVPIPQAMVVIEGTTMGTYADNNGSYSINITPGEHTISVSAYGFGLQKKTIKISSNKSQNFILEKQSINLSEVNVYGKSKSQQLREGAFTVNAIEIEHLASGLINLNTSLGRSSGIKIRKDGGVGSDFDLSINGLSGNSIRYFLDGVPLSSMGYGVSPANIPINIVERIEVYKGVVPAYLGGDALGGAINIITKKEVQNYLDASYSIGSFCTHRADFNALYIHPKTGLFIQPSVGVNYSKNNYVMRRVETRVVVDTVERFNTINARRFHDNYFSGFTQLKMGITNKKWADLFSISSNYFYSDKELQTGSQQKWVYGMVTRENTSFSISGQYQKKSLFIKRLSANLYLSHTWDEKVVVDTAYRQYFWDGSWKPDESLRNEISGGAKSIRHIGRPVKIGRANFNYTINNNYSINLNYLLNHLTNNRYDDLNTDFEPSKDILSKQIIGLSFNQKMWKQKLQNSLFVKDYISHLDIGQQDQYWITGSDSVARSSTTNNRGYGFSSRLRCVKQLAIKGSYEYSVRLPKAMEYLGNGTTINANFKLAPENSDNINMGLFGTFYMASKHRLYYETSVFYRKVEDYIIYIPDKNEGAGQFDNVSNVTIKGIEGELRYDYKNVFKVVANISYLDERNKTKFQNNGDIEATYNNHIPNNPWIFGNLEFCFKRIDVFGQKDNHLMFIYSYQYVHWFYLTWEGYGNESGKPRIPTQYLNNAQITYSLMDKKYNISLACNNILDHTLYDNYKMQKPGRSFFLKLKIFLN